LLDSLLQEKVAHETICDGELISCVSVLSADERRESDMCVPGRVSVSQP